MTGHPSPGPCALGPDHPDGCIPIGRTAGLIDGFRTSLAIRDAHAERCTRPGHCLLLGFLDHALAEGWREIEDAGGSPAMLYAAEAAAAS